MSMGLAIIGGGAMGRAVAQGARAAGLDLGPLVIAEPDSARRGGLAGLGASVVSSAAEAFRELGRSEGAPGEGVILLAVKPQVFRSVAAELGDVGPRRVLSVMAGVTTAAIRVALGGGARVIRLMPNTPASIRMGVTGLCVGEGAGEEDAARAERLFCAVGDVVRVPEALMDAVTAVSGSGPAYLFYVAEALERAAVDAGFDPPTAARLVRGTLAGASRLLAQGVDPATLRRAVTSKGGTTEAACGVLDARGVDGAVMEAVRAATARGAALSAMVCGPS
ncbi:MAG: pyrroline-5-carboxylate reductase [Leptolyngbya sp. PLA1]|nr:pyrroline-5-carboxylate reductase [Leptolyngbya sp. PLA1]